jgi:hypothetical protein
MKMELLALVHYTNMFWSHNGPQESFELRRHVAQKLKQLIHEFINAVKQHRREWSIADVNGASPLRI